MQYINPIEILGFSNIKDIKSLEIEKIKKAKRKLFAEIDLSDNNLLNYYGYQLTKGDCEKVIDELNNNDIKELIHIYIINTQGQLLKNLLNDELESGEHTIHFNKGALPAGMYYLVLQKSNAMEKVGFVVE